MNAQRSIAALAATVLLLTPAVADHGDVRWEAEEPGRLDLEGAGQRTGVPEALKDQGATPGGLRILDDFWDNTGGHAGTPGYAVPRSLVSDGRSSGSPFETYGDTRRTSQGQLNPVILPGASRFLAWYGFWEDKNADGRIDELAEVSAGNEWTQTKGAKLFSYVEPGSRPTVTSKTRPASTDPDFAYVDAGPVVLRLYKSGSAFLGEVLVFLDGSLLQTIRVETVTDPLLSPSGPSRPYTPREDSLVDIDVYPVVAPAQVAAIYDATIGPAMTEVGSPSQGLCPNHCRGLPWSPAPYSSPYTGPVYGEVYERYLQETELDSRSSSAGRLADFQERHRGWADLVAFYATPNDPYKPDVATPLPGRGANGLPAMVPGYLSFEVRTGFWHDASADGYVGVTGDDAYDAGNRPIPDRYEASGGEFLGAYARNATGREIKGHAAVGGQELNVTFRPIPDWGAAGAFLTWDTGTPSLDVLALVCPLFSDPSCLDEWLSRAIASPTGSVGHLSGTESVTVTAVAGTVDPGRYGSTAFLLLPLGTQGFAIEVCTEPLVMRRDNAGVTEDEGVHDCDIIDRLEDIS